MDGANPNQFTSPNSIKVNTPTIQSPITDESMSNKSNSTAISPAPKETLTLDNTRDADLLDLPDDEEQALQAARDTMRDQLSKQQEVVEKSDGMYLHTSHVVLISTVDGVPLTTYLAINVKSNNKDARIVTSEMTFDGQRLNLQPEEESNPN